MKGVVRMQNCDGRNGLPIALIEAMACGVVPICLQTRSGFVEHGVTGLLVRDRGKDFIAAVQRLRQEPLLEASILCSQSQG